MIRNYFTVALRILSRNKFYSLINILGLAVGIGSFMLILLYVNHETSYESFNTKAGSIFRVCENIDNTQGQGEQSSSCPFPVARTLQKELPHLIDKTVRFYNFQENAKSIKVGDKLFNETRIFLADSTALEIFDFPLASGDRTKALDDPGSIVITQELAHKYFGDENPIGKIIRMEDNTDLKVTGLFGEMPRESHLVFDALISFSTLRTQTFGGEPQAEWVWNPCWTYILLKPGVTQEVVEKQFPAYVNKYYPQFIRKQIKHYLQPLQSIHLDSKLSYEMNANGDRQTVYILSLIGLFILVIACINFINLTTARSASRSLEIGVRKVNGATRWQVIRQLMMESMILCVMAMLVSLAFIELLLPLFNSITGKMLRFADLGQSRMLFTFLGVGMLAGLLSGIYPAIMLTAFNPLTALKGKNAASSRGQRIRRFLVVAQFCISLGLIIGTGVVYRQLEYMRSANPGFRSKDILVVNIRPSMAKLLGPFFVKLHNNPHVKYVAAMNDVFGARHNTFPFHPEGTEPGKTVYFPAMMVTVDFLKVFDIPLVAGRDFDRSYVRDDSLAMIINEAMVQHLGWGSPEKALGKKFISYSGRESVTGVAKNFNYISLKNPVGPFVIDVTHPYEFMTWMRYAPIRTTGGNMQEAIASIRADWQSLTKEFPFDYFLLDDSLRQQYLAQESLSKLVAYFAILAVFIACLGLFALASFTAEQRTKEIGVRKVLGASAGNITRLLTIDFIKLVTLSALIAWPVTWYILNEWLSGFAFRINALDYLIYLSATFATFAIAMLTVSTQAIRAALTNPVRALRYE